MAGKAVIVVSCMSQTQPQAEAAGHWRTKDVVAIVAVLNVTRQVLSAQAK